MRDDPIEEQKINDNDGVYFDRLILTVLYEIGNVPQSSNFPGSSVFVKKVCNSLELLTFMWYYLPHERAGCPSLLRAQQDFQDKTACVCACYHAKTNERICIYPRQYKTSSISQSAGLSIPRSSVRFRQKPKNREINPTWI